MTRYEAIADLINDNGFKKICEVGVRYAETMEYVLRHCPVDYYLGVDVMVTPRAEQVKKYFHGKCNILEMPSWNASMLCQSGEFDLVFIDADHSYDMVKQDIESWYPKVRDGGILCGHDYCNPAHRGVEKAVKEKFDKVEEIPDPVFMFVVRKI